MSSDTQPRESESGRRICGARTSHGGICQAQPLRGRERCRMHGGTSAIGPAHHAWKHGKYSRYLNTLQLDRHRELLADGTLLELREEIALITRQLGEVEAELARDDLDERTRQRLEHRQERLFELRARLGEAELRRLQAQQHLVPRAQVLTLVQQIGMVLKEELDQETLARVVDRLYGILRNAGYEPLPGHGGMYIRSYQNALMTASALAASAASADPSAPPASSRIVEA